jgi:hypothetical protein
MYYILSSLLIILASASPAIGTTTDPVLEVSPRHPCAELSDELWAAVERGDIHENAAADITLRCWLND